jgi:pimeloyl-ACP methyl ester carboxylesterase
MEDVRAVMDAARSERAALFGVDTGGMMSIVFAATYPERTAALLLTGTAARTLWAPDHPWGPTEAEYLRVVEEEEHRWGSEGHGLTCCGGTHPASLTRARRNGAPTSAKARAPAPTRRSEG